MGKSKGKKNGGSVRPFSRLIRRSLVGLVVNEGLVMVRYA